MPDELEREAHVESERAIAHDAPLLQTADGVERVDDLQPRNDDERLAAAGAVRRRRRDLEAADLYERLGAFEVDLIRHAFAAGARAQADRLVEAIGTASATVDGPTLRRLNSAYPGLRPAHEAELAARALRFAEASHEPPAALRLADVRAVLRELELRLRRHHGDEDVGEAADVGEELELVDRLRRTIDDLELGVGRLGAAVDGDLEERPE